MIEVKNLSFTYSNSHKKSIDNVSFKIQKGQHISIVGHNGSGKSTIAKLLVGLYKPLSGTITIDGVKFSRENLKKIRSKINIVFQNPDNQFIGATVEDDIAFGLENKRVSREKIHEIILQISKKVGVFEFLNKEPQNLSGGQKQKVAIASTLALEPDIIIFDEVTSMLDPKSKREILKVINELKNDKNKTLISITHDMDEAIMADKILVFSQGKLIADGKPEKILCNKKIIKEASIDLPFIYKISSLIKNIKETYDEKELIKRLCK